MKVKVNGVWVNLENITTTEFYEGSFPDFAGNDGKFLKLVDGEMIWAAGGSGSFSGTMDDIDNGSTYVKTENNFTNEFKADLDGLDAALAVKSDASHNHDSSYSAVGHNHNETYSPIDHNHDGVYQPAGNYAASAHNHDGIYLPASQTKAQFDSACSDGNFMYTGDQGTLNKVQAFATAETTISTATYMDITGCSIALTAGTWIIFAHVVARAANAIIQVFTAITHSDNTVISESATSRPASGTASLNSPISATWYAVVSPVANTTYKLRGARGLTTHTGSWIAMDGNGVNTANHATNNSDKGTGIFAIRIS